MIFLHFTQYTSIHHDQLKGNLNKFINRVFEFKNKVYLITNNSTNKAYFSDSNSKKVCFTKESLIDCINFLIDNSFVVYQDKVYRQIIGIPMGTNAGPQMANSYLHVYEYDYIKELIETGDEDSLLKKLENIFRYQDDLISFNDGGILGNILNAIYILQR